LSQQQTPKRRRGKKAKPKQQGIPDPLGRQRCRFPEQWDRISLEQRTIEAERAAALIESGYGSIRW